MNTTTKTRGRPAAEFTEKEAVEVYLKTRNAHKAVKELKTSYSRLRPILAKNGLLRRRGQPTGPRDIERLREWQELRAKGWTHGKIGEKYGCSRQNVQALLRHHSLKAKERKA